MLETKENKVVIPTMIRKLFGWGFFLGIWLAIYTITYGVVLILLEGTEIELFSSFHATIIILVFFIVMVFYYSIFLIFRYTIAWTSVYFKEKEKEYYEIYKENLYTEQDKESLYKAHLREMASLKSVLLPAVFFLFVFSILVFLFMIIMMYLLAFALTYPPDTYGLGNNVMRLIWFPILGGALYFGILILTKFITINDADSYIEKKLKLQQKKLTRFEKKFKEENT